MATPGALLDQARYAKLLEALSSVARPQQQENASPLLGLLTGQNLGGGATGSVTPTLPDLGAPVSPTATTANQLLAALTNAGTGDGVVGPSASAAGIGGLPSGDTGIGTGPAGPPGGNLSFAEGGRMGLSPTVINSLDLVSGLLGPLGAPFGFVATMGRGENLADAVLGGKYGGTLSTALAHALGIDPVTINLDTEAAGLGIGAPGSDPGASFGGDVTAAAGIGASPAGASVGDGGVSGGVSGGVGGSGAGPGPGGAGDWDRGGPIPMIPGPASHMAATVKEGEYVVKPDRAKRYRTLLDAINQGNHGAVKRAMRDTLKGKMTRG